MPWNRHVLILYKPFPQKYFFFFFLYVASTLLPLKPVPDKIILVFLNNNYLATSKCLFLLKRILPWKLAGPTYNRVNGK